MPNTPQLEQVINNVSPETLTSFFQAACSQFRPSRQDLGHYLDGDQNLLESLQQLGEVEWASGETLMVICGKVSGDMTRRRSRTAQYAVAKKTIKDNWKDAGIFVFLDAQGRFRFSYITAFYSGRNREFSTFKRYTYFVDPARTNKTFRQQIGNAVFESTSALLKAFSIDELSNDFYNQFKPLYDQIVSNVTGTDDKSLKDELALLFVIRIIFLGFVQKKGWFGSDEEFLQSYLKDYLQNKTIRQNQFHEQWLEPLFFEALNNPPGRPVNGGNTPYAENIKNILQMSPYLNGELFKQKKGVDDKGLGIPDNEIEKFFDFLFQYNFTIEENTRYDEELGMNPEFLGIIFERLTNKEDGAVYTPRTEVDFMCRLSLVKWLEKNLSFGSGALEDLYHLLFRDAGLGSEFDDDQKQGDFTKNQIRELIEKLCNLTICDPAAGSGAFEVGMMQVLNDVLQNLQTRSNCPEEFHYLSENDDIEEEKAFQRKKEIIASSLYGVEVKRSAVWINQLRLWLSLFIDMPDSYKTSQNPLLPNLNFKVRCGDSLVQRIGSKIFPIQGHADLPQATKRKVTELKKKKIAFFNNDSSIQLLAITDAELALFEAIIQEEIKAKKDLIAPSDKGASGASVPLFSEYSTPVQRSLFKEKVEAEIRELESELREIRKAESRPLIWTIEFAEVFHERDGFDIIIGNPPYVRQEEIADPMGKVAPAEYKALLKEVVETDYPQHFTSADNAVGGRSDLYTYFYLHSLKLLNPQGTHCFICSNSWLDVGFGVWMQEFLLRNVRTHCIVDNHAKRSFAHADVNTIISIMDAPVRGRTTVDRDAVIKFIAFKKPYDEAIFTDNLLQIERADSIKKTDSYRVYPITVESLFEEGSEEIETPSRITKKYIGDKWGGKYLRAPDIFFTILEKGKDKLVKLKEVAEVRRGITTGCNEFFYLTKQQAEDWGIEEEFLVPAILRTDELDCIDIPEESHVGFFFWCFKSRTDLEGKNALTYIKRGEKTEIEITQGHRRGEVILGYHNIQSVQGRSNWYSLPNRTPTPVWWIIAHNTRAIAFQNHTAMPSDNFFELIPTSISNNGLLGNLNTTVSCFFRELLGRANFGGGLLKTQKPDLQKFLLLKDDFTNGFCQFPETLKNREIKSIFEECGIDLESETPIEQQEPNPLPDRKELDDIVFDALELTQEERKDVYRAVCRLVHNRISRANSV